MNAGLSLLAALDQFAQNDVLLQITDQSISTASALGKKDIQAFLLTQKAVFLFKALSDMLYQQQNLKLAAKAFQWIDFSLEEDKAKYAALDEKRTHLEKEIAALEAGVLAEIQSNRDHYFQGKVLMGLAEIAFSRFMYDRGAVMNGGPWKAKIMNMYFVRRWNLDKLIGYDSRDRMTGKHERRFQMDSGTREDFPFASGTRGAHRSLFLASDPELLPRAIHPVLPRHDASPLAIAS